MFPDLLDRVYNYKLQMKKESWAGPEAYKTSSISLSQNQEF
jgi:hypothetical protein